ncbi:DUF2520 domain-containing protein [Lutibacter sp. A64]|uniref:Rossmann-like and DUF2520 domain-containing protein n=1 Tax=Lutibacter sp. A64 TaxID=2918526 RepID=UPI001F06CDB6|nr:DUF2520 domain-containing protein [Lutibacter sp. A64]UMB54489.1 DUF2520 domain-containing protein [Lutibacter sp. A64]
MIKISIIGGGNVAYHLTAILLKTPTVKLVEVYNRTLDKIQYLKHKTAITANLNTLKDADIYIICVSDNAIEEVSKQLNFSNKLVVHTSGSVALNELKCNANKGVFYLLQSFSKNKNIDFSSIPICLEAETKKDLELLETLAKKISKNSYYINSKQRKNIHVSAVFINNFVNHLYYIGNQICEENEVPFEILRPLIKETASKIETLTPFDAQTGPAKRNDTKTLKKHEAMLSKNQKEIYKLLSQSIYNTYGKKL